MFKTYYSVILLFFSGLLYSCDYQAILLSDIHLLPDSAQKMPYTPSERGSDLDTSTFYSLMNKIIHMPEYREMEGIFLLGDITGHNVSFSKRIAIETKIFSFFGALSKPTYIINGNNDSLLGNYQAYSRMETSAYALAKEVWGHSNSGFISLKNIQYCLNDDRDSYPCLLAENSEEGHYSVRIKPKLTLITLNSVLFNGDYVLNYQRTAIPALQWLSEQLRNSARDRNSVILAMHVPPGVNLYSKKYHFREKISLAPVFQRQFIKVLEQAVKKEHLNILAILGGHTHHDELHFIKSDKQIIPVIINPALSTSHGNAPAFQTICLSKKDEVWSIEGLRAYSIRDEQENFELYKDLVADVCNNFAIRLL